MDFGSRWWNTPFMKQIWTSSGVLINILGQGMVMGYPSCLLHELRAPDSTIQLDLNAASWIASANCLANMGGFIMSSILMDWCGRKISFIIITIPSILGWMVIYIASDVPTLIIGRLLGGLSGGAIAFLAAIIIGEYTSPKIRGVLLNLKTTAVCIGILVVHLMGGYYDWRTIALLAVIPKIASLIIVSTWPESPAWLASKQRYEESKEEYIWLRGDSAEATREYEDFIIVQRQKWCMDVEEVGFRGVVIDFFKKFTRRDFIRPVSILLFGGILIEACGKHMFPAYAKQIFGSLSANENEAFYFTISFDLIACVSTVVASILIKIIKRRTLLFRSGVPALIILLTVCLYLYLVSKGIVSNTTWIAFIGLLMFFILANMGCTLIPLVLFGEIMPLAHKAASAIVVGITISVCTVVGLKMIPYSLETIKLHGTFTILGGIIGVCLLALYILQPETKDRTLQEIEDEFNCGTRLHSQVKKDREVTEKILNAE